MSQRFNFISFLFKPPCKDPHEVVGDRAGFFEKKNFCLKIWENEPKMVQKHSFLNLLKNLVINFYWIYSAMETNIICCVPAQISYLG